MPSVMIHGWRQRIGSISDSGGIRSFRQLQIFGAVDVPNGMMQIEVSSHERDVLLRGLRYVRSSIMLELREPEKEDTRRRSSALDEIQMLCQRLENSDPQLSASL